MRQFVDHEGRSFKATHVGLRNARNRGGRAAMWAKVDEYNSQRHIGANF